jgi:hypothetical protein
MISYKTNSFVGFMRGGLIFLLLISFCYSAFATNVMVTKGFSGIWDQPDQESQGLLIQISEQVGDQKVAVVNWFTYGDDQEATWYLANGPINGNELNMKLYAASGIGFMEPNAEGDVNVQEVGTLDLVFQNCKHGMAYFNTPDDVIGSGEFPIKKLIGMYRTRCSGGISDDTPPNAKPSKLEVELEAVSDDFPGEGDGKFWERTDRSDFQVHIKKMPEGSGPYTLQVCSAPQGEIEVVDGSGKIDFRSPESESHALLSFDPRDCLIEILDGETVVLSSGDSVLAEKQKGNNGGGGNGNPNVKIDVDLDNTGVIEDAEGLAKYAIHGGNPVFEVRVEGVPVGMYSLVVDGLVVGDIEVATDDEDEDGKAKGKLKFSDPEKEDTLLLDFDPRGTVVEILQDSTVILDVLFPEE